VTDFQMMSPAELRDFAKAKDVDTSSIDARRKAQLVGLLSAWEAGQAYDPPEPEATPERSAQSSSEPEISEDYAQSIVEEYSGTTIDDQVAERQPRTLVELTLDDLVNDRDRVVVQVNTFPVTVDGLQKCRLMLVEVPGEGDTLAAAWWVNSVAGPVLVAGVRRVSERHRDSESGVSFFTTEDGEQHTYQRTQGCTTCGNRLANWRPWSSPVRIVQAARR